MNKRDYYTVLGLEQACASQDVRQSFYKLALKWHPDKCQDKSEAELKFTEIHEAYTVLSDPSKRKVYDQHGHRGLDSDQDSLSNPNKRNKFFEKGFQGVEKSAFDVLNDILKENEDGYFFQNYEGFGIPDTLKSTMKNFIEEKLFKNDQDINSSSFFDTYKPTFMNPDFFMKPAALFKTEADNHCTTSFFSSQSTGLRDSTYSRTSTTVFQNEKATTSSTETFESNTNIYQKIQINDCNQPDSEQASGKKETPKMQRASYIVINESVLEDPVLTYKRDAEFYALLELSRGFVNEDEATFNINASSKKITKNKESLNIRLMKKKPSKKNRI